MSERGAFEMSDERLAGLLDRARKGDEAARRELEQYLYEELRRIVSPVLRGRFARVGDLVETDDVLNEVFCRMVARFRESEKDFRGGVEGFRRFAARVLRNTLIDLTRRRFGSLRGHRLADGADEFDPRLAESSGMSGWRTRASVGQLIDRIEDEDDKLIIMLVYFGNLMNRDLAKVLGCSEGQASRRRGAALERFGRLLEGTGLEPEAGSRDGSGAGAQGIGFPRA